MTDPNKAAVLAKWPNAACLTNGLAIDPNCYFYIEAAFSIVGQGNTEDAAWADAARRLG